MRFLPLLMLPVLALATPAAAKWREASSDHFVIYSEESADSLRAFATKLERYDAAMRHLRGIPDEAPGKANRLTVYVVSNVGTVRKLAGGRSNFIAGFYVPRASGSIAVVPRRLGSGGRWDMDPENVLLHEYAHHFLFQNSSAAYPAWFSEGYAEFYATAKFEKDGSVGLGLPAAHRGYGLVSGNPLPVERMMALGSERLSPEQREALYGRGWLLTHYLTFEPSRRGQLTAYLNALNSGKTGVEAATAAFGDLKTLGRDLDAYMRRPRLSYVKIGADAVKIGPIAVREVGAGEDALMDAKIRSRRGVNATTAQPLLAEIRRLAAPFANDPAVQATLAEAEYDAGNWKEAEAAADRALAADPRSIDAMIYKSRARMKLAEGGKDAAAWKEVRRLLAAANRLDPDDPEPLILFYNSFGAQGVPATANAVAGLNRAHELAPQDRGLSMLVARQYLVDGKPAEARAALAPLAFDPHGGEASAAVAAIIAQLDAGGAADALKAWRAKEDEKTEEGS